MRNEHELRLAGEPDAVPRARRFVTEVLGDHPDLDLVAAAELTVSELVTNALLHAGPTVTIRLGGQDHDGLRIEVYDSSSEAPVRGAASPNSMTGRGIALVDSLASQWGVEPTREGKYVWCELVSAEPGVATAPAAHNGSTDHSWEAHWPRSARRDEKLYTVRLGDVPTALLVAAKEHVDNVVRELTLASTGAVSGASTALQPQMIRLVDAVVNRFVDARQSIKRQAAAAARAGLPRTELTLTLPLSAAVAGEEYLVSLDEADLYARAARLLTLETPPQHRAFRHWYVESLARQLRAAAAGETIPAPMSFEQHLLSELDAAATAQRAAAFLADRLTHLQQLTTDLTRATDIAEIAEVVVSHAGGAFGASFSALHLLEGDVLELVAHFGGAAERMAPYQSIPPDAKMPAREALETNAPVVVPAGAVLSSRYPDAGGDLLVDRSIVCVPLSVGERRLGVISLTFPWERDVSDPDEVAFLSALADACGQAIDRARALTQARETAEKLEFLADASAELSASLSYRTTLGNIARLMVPRLADYCSVQTVGDGGFDNVAIAHVDPAKVALAEDLQNRFPTDPDSPSGVPEVVRTGKSVLVPTITDEMLRAGSTNPEQLEISRELQLSSVLIVPLTGNDGTFGAITMIYAESGRHYGEADRALAEELAHRAAMAVDRARAFRQQTGRLATITRIAEAAQHAILAPVPQRVGPLMLAGRYVSAAKEALVGGDLYEVVATPTSARLLIGDVRGKGLEAVRLATVVLGFFRSAAVDASPLTALARHMDDRLAPYLAEEDFVTALLMEVTDDGECQLVSCGHPAPMVARGKTLTLVNCPTTVPLGLGVDPVAFETALAAGDRLLLYTDGLMEARGTDGEAVDLDYVTAPLARNPLPIALDNILGRLRAKAGDELDDDLALLAAEFRPL